MTCPSCGLDVLDIDVKCSHCGANLAPTGAHRLVGTTVLGQYRIEAVLGQGGMSVVFRARHALTEQEVALKVLPPDLAAYSQVKSRFLEEARALAQLDHPNIVHLYNFGQENGSFVLAMQFVAGQTWERLILEGGRQDWPTATRIAIDVLRALEYAHGRGVIHRDMKPSNVLVRDDDHTATVMDFGIAKMTTSTRLTATGQTMGTVRYMSPEQVRGQDVDARSDIYSLGATLYEALVGETPFDGNTHFEIMSKHLTEVPVPPSSRDVDLPAALEAALMKAMAKKADDRFADARELRKELERILKDGDVGLAETQRMSRDMVAQARGGGARRPSTAPPRRQASAPPVGRAAAPAAPSGPADAGSARRGGGATGLADRLEPEADRPVAARSRTNLWLALGGLVLVAGAGVGTFAVVKNRRAGATAPDAAVAAGTAAAGTATIKEFEPPDVTWRASGEAPDLVVRIATPIDWTPADVTAAYRKVRAAVPGVLAGRAPEPLAYPELLTLQVVPRATLCDPRVFESGSPPGDCKDLLQYFRVRERTLLVADDRALLEPILAQAVAEIVCMFNESVDPCFTTELVEAVKRPG